MIAAIRRDTAGKSVFRIVASRRGSAIVEATMVLPLLILSVITCLLICMFFYDSTISQCQLHQQLRCEADAVTGQTILPKQTNPPDRDAANSSITTSRHGIFMTVSGKEHTAMIHQGILHSRVSADVESLWHASDGVSYVRYCTLARDLTQDR